MRSINLLSRLLLLGLAFALAGCRGGEAAFPTKPVEVVVTFPAGGSTDLLMRPLAEAAAGSLGQQVVVVNKPGGAGTIGTGEVARAKADGYTVLVVSAGPAATQPHLGDVPYRTEDFEPLLLAYQNPLLVVAGGHTSWQSVREFVDDAKRRPGQITFGATPAGGVPHLAMALLEKTAGIRVNSVPFQGAAPGMTALLGGHVDLINVHPAEVAPYVGTAKLRILGAYQSARLKEFPDVPTMREQGFDVVAFVWGGLAVPKGTHEAVRKKLRDAFKQGLESQQVKDTWANLRMSPSYLPPDEFLKLWKEDFERYGELIRALKQEGVLKS